MFSTINTSAYVSIRQHTSDLLRVGEGSEALVLDDKSAFGRLAVAKGSGPVTHCAHTLARRPEGLHELDAGCVT